jgi:hypothetical protein
MPENDSTPGTPRRKSKKVKTGKPDNPGGMIRPPILCAGQVYFQEDFIANFEISPATFRRWEAAGFQASRPWTKRKYIISDDVIEFIRQHPNLMGEDGEA